MARAASSRGATIEPDAVTGADQVLVGRNNTRRNYNTRIRQLLGRDSPTPVADDVLVCLRNDRKRGLLNGSLWRVDKVRAPRKGLLRYALTPEDGVTAAPAPSPRSTRPISTAPPTPSPRPPAAAPTPSTSAMC